MWGGARLWHSGEAARRAGHWWLRPKLLEAQWPGPVPQVATKFEKNRRRDVNGLGATEGSACTCPGHSGEGRSRRRAVPKNEAEAGATVDQIDGWEGGEGGKGMGKYRRPGSVGRKHKNWIGTSTSTRAQGKGRDELELIVLLR
eukprot:GHVT01080370.1.p1 GENE.GHVT01080370.1~~GHVT01080370.1.p1  ORF type:complete len:144 (-),score=19.57 GHVT01080370.1:140-571(-)